MPSHAIRSLTVTLLMFAMAGGILLAAMWAG